MKKFFAAILVGLFIITYAGAVHAYLFDTGERDSDPNTYDAMLHEALWSAVEFTIDVDYTITDIETQVDWLFGMNGQFTAVLYTDGGDVPGTQLQSAKIIADNASFAWVGTDTIIPNLNWDITAGTYWVAFEVRSGEGDGFDGDIATNTLFPLVNEAFSNGGPYMINDSITNIAVRISGTPKSVPIPSTLGLISLGLLGMAAFKKKIQCV
ncbi:MAG: hypothetical protein GY699_19680 [Desulfobacteraceae bacterium]|nr:hypothetical protein [Desulfobacteraceae bacterium]